LRRNNFRVLWAKACRDAGLPGVHFHDLRHTGNTLAAATGASLRELMERMGHSSTRAALIYQHASKDRDKAIAKAVGEMFATARKQAKPGGRSGTQRARKRPAGS
jgi:integrase